MRISDWSSDVCSSDLGTYEQDVELLYARTQRHREIGRKGETHDSREAVVDALDTSLRQTMDALSPQFQHCEQEKQDGAENLGNAPDQNENIEIPAPPQAAKRSEENQTELQSLMRISNTASCW